MKVLVLAHLTTLKARVRQWPVIGMPMFLLLPHHIVTEKMFQSVQIPGEDSIIANLYPHAASPRPLKVDRHLLEAPPRPLKVDRHPLEAPPRPLGADCHPVVVLLHPPKAGHHRPTASPLHSAASHRPDRSLGCKVKLAVMWRSRTTQFTL